MGRQKQNCYCFTDGIIVYVENPKESANKTKPNQKQTLWKGNIAKSQGIRLIYKSQLLYYRSVASNWNLNNNAIYKSTPRMMCLGIHPIKYTKDLNAENYKTLVKEIR